MESKRSAVAVVVILDVHDGEGASQLIARVVVDMVSTVANECLRERVRVASADAMQPSGAPSTTRISGWTLANR